MTLLQQIDCRRIMKTVEFLVKGDAPAVLAALPGEFARYCRLDHAAVLVFPRSFDGFTAELRDHGVEVGGEHVPSVVVRERLARRYDLPPAALDVRIFHAPAVDGREIEIFALATSGGGEFDKIVSAERWDENEAHIAFSVTEADPIVLCGLRAALLEAGYGPDGGGYNPHEDATVLYFRFDAGEPLERRVELTTPGRHAEVLARHTPEQDRPARELLRLMTGAWATQAVGVAAKLELADLLTAGRSVASVAQAVGADTESLRRLLRYLAGLGVVRRSGDTFEPTAVGKLLCGDAANSFQPLAVLYSTLFYRSFGSLEYSVRTGQVAFEQVFGQEHFGYVAERADLAGLFDRAMASTASMFGRVAELVDLSQARTVVDIAGGNGELLIRLLRAAPHLRGVLLERAHVVENARAAVARTDCADRCEFVVGDFTVEIPEGGDVYLLSRVLHDWNDEQCLRILDRCAEAMAPGASLLVIERLLPEDDSPSLAVAWDLHMMCNVGGRERTAARYAELLSKAGFAIRAIDGLPLDVALLSATRT